MLRNMYATCANIQCESKSKTLCNIFTWAEYISVKFCWCIASLYLHIFTNFGRFILIFNKMALIFLRVLIVFSVSSFDFHQVCTEFERNGTFRGWVIGDLGNTFNFLGKGAKPRTILSDVCAELHRLWGWYTAITGKFCFIFKISCSILKRGGSKPVWWKITANFRTFLPSHPV